jgi:hypothetical protein
MDKYSLIPNPTNAVVDRSYSAYKATRARARPKSHQLQRLCERSGESPNF